MGTGYFFTTGGRSIGGSSGAAACLGMKRTTFKSRMGKRGSPLAPDADISAHADMSARLLRHRILLQIKVSPLASSNQQSFQ